MLNISQSRGRPVAAMVLLLGVWVAGRMIVLDADEPEPGADEASRLGDRQALPQPEFGADAARNSSGGVPWPAGGRNLAEAGPVAAAANGKSTGGLAPGLNVTAGSAEARHVPLARVPGPIATPLPALQSTHAPVPVTQAAGHLSVWMSAMARLPDPRSLPGLMAAPAAAQPQGEARASAPALPARARPDRWSADSWLMLRRGGNAGIPGAFAPSTYGASQEGAVLRYRLAPESAHRPTAFVRATAALNHSEEREAALGLSLRPAAALPVSVGAEMRLTHNAWGTRLRPAVSAVTELPPFDLPAGLRGEAYVQAGYVGGKGKTGFVDGQVKADALLAGADRFDLRAGGGVWGGAQEGASRLDVGPSASLTMQLNRAASARVAVDWRFRVAGNARPDSGPALTLSAGF